MNLRELTQKISGFIPRAINRAAVSLGGPAFSNWTQDLAEDYRKRGLFEATQDLFNPLLMNRYIEPIAEPHVSRMRVGRRQLGQLLSGQPTISQPTTPLPAMPYQPQTYLPQVARGMENVALDLPFHAANISRGIKQHMLFNAPFREEEWIPEKEHQRRTNLPPTSPEMVRGSIMEGLPSPEAGRSARLMPFLSPPRSDVSLAQRREILGQYGMRPAAVQYLSQIPIKVGDRYLTPAAGRSLPAGQAYHDPRFIALSPQTADPRVLRHEYLHQAPRLIPRKFQSRVPQTPESLRQFTEMWGKSYIESPGRMGEERFAERALPSIFTRHIFKPGRLPWEQ